jgi:hypothetical protein
MTTMIPSANNNNPRTAILGHMLWSNEDISAALALQRMSAEARWNDIIGDSLKGGAGVVLPTEGLHNKLAIKTNRITLLNSRYDLLKFLFS